LHAATYDILATHDIASTVMTTASLIGRARSVLASAGL